MLWKQRLQMIKSMHAMLLCNDIEWSSIPLHTDTARQKPPPTQAEDAAYRQHKTSRLLALMTLHTALFAQLYMRLQ